MTNNKFDHNNLTEIMSYTVEYKYKLKDIENFLLNKLQTENLTDKEERIVIEILNIILEGGTWLNTSV